MEQLRPRLRYLNLMLGAISFEQWDTAWSIAHIPNCFPSQVMALAFRLIKKVILSKDKRQAEFLIFRLSQIWDSLYKNDFPLLTFLLIYSICKGQKSIVQLTLNEGVNVDKLDDTGRAPLHFAVTNATPGQYEIVELLLAHGAFVDQRDYLHFTPLCFLLRAQNFDENLAEILIRHGASINGPSNICNTCSSTPVHYACVRNNTKGLKLLLRHNADINTESEYGETCLQFAVKHKSVDCVKILLENGASVNTSSKNGQTALHLAVLNNDCELAELLLQNNAKVNVYNMKETLRNSIIMKTDSHDRKCVFDCLQKYEFTFSPEDGSDYKLVHAAVCKGYTSVVLHLLNLGANPNCIFKTQPLLHTALIEGHKDIVYLLIKHGCDIHKTNSDGVTSLDLAVDSNNLEITTLLLSSGHKIDSKSALLCVSATFLDINMLTILLQHGANVNATNGKGWSVLHCCIFSGLGMAITHDESDTVKAKVIRFLLTHGAVVDAYVPPITMPPLHYAVAAEYTQVVSVLLEFGASLNFASYKGNNIFTSTVLHTAAMMSSTRVMKLLIQREMRMVNAKDHVGETPLLIAVKRGSPHMVKMLLEHEADVTERSTDNQTILQVGVRNGFEHVVIELLKFGVDVDGTDDLGRTPLHIACLLNQGSVMKVLLSYGADINALCKNKLLPFMYLRKYICNQRTGSRTVFDHRIVDVRDDEDENAAASPKSVLNNFQNHIFKMAYIGLYVHEAHKPFLEYLHSEDFVSHCKGEVELMKTTKIGDSFFLYEAVKQVSDPNYAVNDAVMFELESKDFSKILPLYSGIIKYIARKAKMRYQLMNFGQKWFSFLMNLSHCSSCILPNELVRKIISLLEDEDIRNVISCGESF